MFVGTFVASILAAVFFTTTTLYVLGARGLWSKPDEHDESEAMQQLTVLLEELNGLLKQLLTKLNGSEH